MCPRGLFEAAEQSDTSRTGGLHKYRYRVARCPLASVHSELKTAAYHANRVYLATADTMATMDATKTGRQRRNRAKPDS